MKTNVCKPKNDTITVIQSGIIKKITELEIKLMTAETYSDCKSFEEEIRVHQLLLNPLN